ncbi:MAG: hypothetical protein HQK53_00665 [Oligoflexia bacterium]|nr:hypothetical protein [Oligoflexia bacterium]
MNKNKFMENKVSGCNCFEMELFKDAGWYLRTADLRSAVERLKLNLCSTDVNVDKGSASGTNSTTNTTGSTVPGANVEIKWSNFLECIGRCKECSYTPLNSNAVLPVPRRIHNYAKSIRKIKVLFVGEYPPSTYLTMQQLKSSSEKMIFFSEEKDSLLQKIAVSIGLSEEDYSISFSIKCHPVDELEDLRIDGMMRKCRKYLLSEICLLKPLLIITLGPIPLASLLEREEKLSLVHGQFFERNFRYEMDEKGIVVTDSHKALLFPIFNLEYLILNPQMKRMVWSDLQKVIKFLESNHQ